MKTFCYSLMLVIPSFFAVASSAFAQSQFSYGANVYANFARPAFYVPWSARVFCEGAEGAVQRFSYSGGISFFYKVSDKIHLQSGLNYVNTGVLHKTTFAYDDYNLEELSRNHTTHMLEVPLNVKYKFRKGKESGLYALAGSGIWLNVSNNLKVTENLIVGDSRTYYSPDKYSTYTKWNVPFTLGVGYNFPVSENLTLYIQPTAQITAKAIAENVAYAKFRSFRSTGLTIGTIFK